MKKINNSIEEIMSILDKKDFYNDETNFLNGWGTTYDKVFGTFGNILYRDFKCNYILTRSLYTENINDYFNDSAEYLTISHCYIVSKEKVYAKQSIISAITKIGVDDNDKFAACLFLGLITKDNIDKIKQLMRDRINKNNINDIGNDFENNIENDIDEQIIIIDKDYPLFGYWKMLLYDHSSIDKSFNFGELGFLKFDDYDYIFIQDWDNIFTIVNLADTIEVDSFIVSSMLETFETYYYKLTSRYGSNNLYYLDRIKCNEVLGLKFLM